MVSASSWPFADPRNCAVFVTREVMDREEPILLVTHDHRVAQKYASAVIRLVDGQVTDDSSSAIRVAVQ